MMVEAVYFLKKHVIWLYIVFKKGRMIIKPNAERTKTTLYHIIRGWFLYLVDIYCQAPIVGIPDLEALKDQLADRSMAVWGLVAHPICSDILADSDL